MVDLLLELDSELFDYFGKFDCNKDQVLYEFAIEMDIQVLY